MSAHLESGDKAASSGRKSTSAVQSLVKLSEAARALGYHVETLRIRVRRGELPVTRGPHGTYFVSRAVLKGIGPPRRSRRRKLELALLEWTWVLLEEHLEEAGAGNEGVQAVQVLHRDPSLNKRLHLLLSVHRLRLAGLTSIEIAGLLEISDRHVRRLARRNLADALVESGLDLESRERARAMRTARRVVSVLQHRLGATGFHYHQRPWQLGDLFTPVRRAPAHLANKVFREEIVHLRDAGLSDDEIQAIQLVGIGQDQLHELIMRGLRGQPLPPRIEPSPPMPK